MPAKKTTSKSNTKAAAKRPAGKAGANKESKKGVAKTKARGRTQAATQPTAASKYDQPGAPWWKKIPLPIPK